MDLKNKRVLVAGAGRSGVAAGRLLRSEGEYVTLQDVKEEAKLGSTAELGAGGFELYLGRNPDEIVHNFEMVVLSPGIAIDTPFVKAAKRLGIPVIAEIELAFAFATCPITAITGTNGKTTTTSLVTEIMRRRYSTAVVGNIGIAFSEHVKGLGEGDWIVAEVSSFQLESIDKFRPKISAVLNISPDHLNRHKTMETYIATKERIFANQQDTDFLILNHDDTVCREMAGRSAAKVVWFSRLQELPEGIFRDGDKIVARAHDDRQEVIRISDMQIIGDHNVENAMASTAMCLAAGIPIEDIAAGIRSFKGVEHRLEFVKRLRGVDYFNDSKATNVDSAVKSLEAMSKPVVLICGGSDKGADFEGLVGMFAGRVKHSVVIGEVSSKICEVLRAHSITDYTRASTMGEAVAIASGKAGTGDVVLLSPACASFDMFDNFEQRGREFKKFVKAL